MIINKKTNLRGLVEIFTTTLETCGWILGPFIGVIAVLVVVALSVFMQAISIVAVIVALHWILTHYPSLLEHVRNFIALLTMTGT